MGKGQKPAKAEQERNPAQFSFMTLGNFSQNVGILTSDLIPVRLAKAPERGYPFCTMSTEPVEKRAVAFFDGQNLFRCAQTAFGITYPSFDPIKLSQTICTEQGWHLKQVRFYTGMPDANRDPHWNHFWTQKLRAVGRKAHVVTRPLRYRTQTITFDDGSAEDFEYKVEKGIDVRLAIDIVMMAVRQEFDIGLIFSQDQDLNEVVHDVTAFAKSENRWIKLASAFPSSPTYNNRRGIDGTDWIRIEQALYDSCIDPADYHPKKTAMKIPGLKS